MQRTLKSFYALLVAAGLALPVATYALNPQPEPPAPTVKKKLESPLTRKAINPQPEPPGAGASRKPVSPGAKQGFNPQPEPPGDKLSAPAAGGATKQERSRCRGGSGRTGTSVRPAAVSPQLRSIRCPELLGARASAAL
jgi:hypothetical protein